MRLVKFAMCFFFVLRTTHQVAMPSMPNSFRVYSSALIFCRGVSSAVRSPVVVEDADMPRESPGQKSQYPFPEATLVSEVEEEYVFRVNATAFVNLDPFEEWVVYASSDCRGEELAHYQVARWISNQTAQVYRTCANVFPLSGLHKTYFKVSIREEATYPPRVFHKTPVSSKECVYLAVPPRPRPNEPFE